MTMEIIVLAANCSSTSPAKTRLQTTSAAETSLSWGPSQQKAPQMLKVFSNPPPNTWARPPTKTTWPLFQPPGDPRPPSVHTRRRHEQGCGSAEWDMLVAITALRYLLFHPGPQLTPCSSLKSIRFMPLPSSLCAPVSHQFCLQWFSSDLAPVSNAPLTPHDTAIVLHLFSLLSMLLPAPPQYGKFVKAYPFARSCFAFTN